MGFITSNVYLNRIPSPYGNYRSPYRAYTTYNQFSQLQAVTPRNYNRFLRQTIELNAALNAEAQDAVNAKEPGLNVWELDGEQQQQPNTLSNFPDEKKGANGTTKGAGMTTPASGSFTYSNGSASKPSKLAGLKKALSIKSPEEKAHEQAEKMRAYGRNLRDQILQEERGRWPDGEWQQIARTYQHKVGMAGTVAYFRAHCPMQYLHMLRAGYFEPIPVAWANQISNPLKFMIDPRAGWRGITPAWRGYEDTAEERLYWVLNHREGSRGARLKPDIISALNMARDRMATAVEPPPVYFSSNDTCHVQHKSDGYSRQVMPAPFRAVDGRESATDHSMILLDVSGSMDFDPMRPNYDGYLITGFTRTTQPKNKGG